MAMKKRIITIFAILTVVASALAWSLIVVWSIVAYRDQILF